MSDLIYERCLDFLQIYELRELVELVGKNNDTIDEILVSCEL